MNPVCRSVDLDLVCRAVELDPVYRAVKLDPVCTMQGCLYESCMKVRGSGFCLHGCGSDPWPCLQDPDPRSFIQDQDQQLCIQDSVQ